jgi:hypothetical protein
MTGYVAQPGEFERQGLYDLESRAYSRRHEIIKKIRTIEETTEQPVIQGYQLNESLELLKGYIAGARLNKVAEEDRQVRADALANGMKFGILVGSALMNGQNLELSMSPFLHVRLAGTFALNGFLEEGAPSYLGPRPNLALFFDTFAEGFTSSAPETQDARMMYGLTLLLADQHLQDEHIKGLTVQNDLDVALAEWSAAAE